MEAASRTKAAMRDLWRDVTDVPKAAVGGTKWPRNRRPLRQAGLHLEALAHRAWHMAPPADGELALI